MWNFTPLIRFFIANPQLRLFSFLSMKTHRERTFAEITIIFHILGAIGYLTKSILFKVVHKINEILHNILEFFIKAN